MVKFNLITGFLGSGKTTLLSNLLNELSAETRIAVIQNEYAPSGVDGKMLQQNAPPFKLIEINNGSVFCVCQLSNFEQTLAKLLVDYQPEIIFLETSGLADPISIAELLQVSSLENKVTLDKMICLVDAENFFKGLNTLVRFKHQIMIADTVILNKTDLCTAAGIKEIRKAIIELNPFAEIIESQYAKVSWDKLIKDNTTNGFSATRFKGWESEGRPDMKTCVLRLHDPIGLNGLKGFVQHLQANCIRIKGFVNLLDGTTVLMQSVYESLEIEPVEHYSGRTEIIVFGNNIELGQLRKLFKHYSAINYQLKKSE